MATEGIRGSQRASAAGSFRQAREVLRELAQRVRRRTDASAPPVSAPGADGDRADILTLATGNNGAVRPEKIHEARERIASGYYDRPEVRASLVRHLLENFGEETGEP